jgi:hypothetical protein
MDFRDLDSMGEVVYSHRCELMNHRIVLDYPGGHLNAGPADALFMLFFATMLVVAFKIITS